jgi:hypothetical protein
MGRQSRQIKTPTSVPAVPGAKGARPEPNPVASNVISFPFKVPSIIFFLTIGRSFYVMYFMKVKRTLQDVEKKITAFFLENGRMPSYSEIADIIGVRSKSVSHFWSAKLLEAGILQKGAKGFITLTRNPRALKLAREVCAGIPSPAE